MRRYEFVFEKKELHKAVVNAENMAEAVAKAEQEEYQYLQEMAYNSQIPIRVIDIREVGGED